MSFQFAHLFSDLVGFLLWIVYVAFKMIKVVKCTIKLTNVSLNALMQVFTNDILVVKKLAGLFA